MIDFQKSRDILVKDRREYLKRCVKQIQGYVDHGYDDLAAQAIITVAECVTKVTGSIEYLDQIKSFEDEYPRFMRVFEYD